MRAFATNGKTEARVHLARNIYWDLDSYFTSGDIRKRIIFFFNYVTDMNDRSRVQPFFRGGTKTRPEKVAEIEPRGRFAKVDLRYIYQVEASQCMQKQCLASKA